METYTKIPRSELVAQLRERDGDLCRHPDCGKPIDFDLTEGHYMATLDHREPQVWCRENDWTMDQIWSLDNLDLMHRRCNANKGDRRYREDGTLPEKPQSKFRFRRQNRAGRPELCEICDNGHNLFVGEVCANCGCNAQRFPRWAKVRAPDCSHDITWCWACSIGIVERKGAIEMMLLGGEGGEE